MFEKMEGQYIEPGSCSSASVVTGSNCPEKAVYVFQIEGDPDTYGACAEHVTEIYGQENLSVAWVKSFTEATS